MEPSNAVLVAGGAFTFFGGMIGGELGLPVVAFLTSVASSITAVRILKIEAVTVQVFGHFPPK
jgi:hypothetical protein